MAFKTEIRGVTVYADSIAELRQLIAEFGNSDLGASSGKQPKESEDATADTPRAARRREPRDLEALDRDVVKLLKALASIGVGVPVPTQQLQLQLGIESHHRMGGLKLSAERLLRSHGLTPERVFKTYGNRYGRFWNAEAGIKDALLKIEGIQPSLKTVVDVSAFG